MWPTALRPHDWQDRLGHPQRAEEIGFDLVAGFGFGDLLDGAEQAVAGIVDGDIDAAEAFVRLLHRGIDGRLVADVEGKRQQPVAVSALRSSRGAMLREAAATLSPRASAASVHTRPKPLDVPVMNQTLGEGDWDMEFVLEKAIWER